MAQLTLDQLLANFQRFNAQQAADEIVVKNGPFLIDMIQEQMMRGKGPDDRDIVPTYFKKSYELYKQSLNSAPKNGVPDLNLDGGYYAGMKIEKSANGVFEAFSTDEKAAKLKKKYGDNIKPTRRNANRFRNKNDKDFIVKVETLFK